MTWQRKGSKKGSSMAESAITLPVVVLLTFAMVNLAMAWYAAVAASNAANYGARVGSVSQVNPAANAVAATQGRLDAISVGTYAISANGGGYRGAQVNVVVDWAVPNYIGSLITYIGGGDQMNFEGTALSTFRQEGW
ncbi:TadE/TadG family type IV pilus assembly protein [Pelolinea submarina]|uniref:TadE-like protein n=1 Tax=Pelolinea submarina TaxID=913107 RepID=A0A3E0AN57_9CHLR|nr:TadE/TadG family type IV pilus assembly protein [Pelolinea submarina]REG11370.1 TadE-like protein [Pelolinea submarina]